MSKRKVGKVYLVGAGPGDPHLLTLRGRDLLEEAEAVVVDALVDPRLLRYAPSARIHLVGKRGPGAPRGASRVIAQKKIYRLMSSLARAGKKVVRLKGGDPFVFGRGCEEIEELIKKGIPYEIVPGVSSVWAVPAYAGIPLTDRRFSSHVTLITGQQGTQTQGVDWGRISPQGTLVVLMGVSSWGRIRKKLIALGWSPSQGVVAIERGTSPQQRVLHSTLQRSALDFKRARLVAPAIIVVGRVSQLGARYRWLAKEKPLLGVEVVVTRSTSQNRPFISLLQEKGAYVTSVPAIRIEPLKEDPLTNCVLSQLVSKEPPIDEIIFLSRNGVETFSSLIQGRKVPLRRLKMSAVGPQTAKVMEEKGWRVDRIAKDFNSRGILNVLGPLRGKRILIPRVQGGPRDLVQTLRRKGAEVVELSTYRTVSAAPPSEFVKRQLLRSTEVITFTSASTVRAFAAFFSPRELRALFKKARALSIGPLTTKALHQQGIENILQTSISTTAGMVEHLCRQINVFR